MKSGKVFLVSNDGRKYSLSPGMTCTFAQYAAAIAVDATAPSPVVTNLESSSSSKGNDNKNANNVETSTKGTFHLLGSISRKIIVVPEYEIGSRKWEDEEAKSVEPFKQASVPVKGLGTRPERSNSLGTEVSDTEYERGAPMSMEYQSDND
jgi:RNA polymerase III RPC4